MNRFSAHIGYLYAGLPLAKRVAAAARDGFTAVEHPGPYEVPAAEMRSLLMDTGLAFSMITSGMGDAGRGERGLAAVIGREAAFREGFLRALDYAEAVGCPFVHPMAGVPVGSWLDAGATYDANLAWAIEACAGTNARVLVEAITAPGYYLGSLKDAAALQDRFGGAFCLLFDSFHAATLGEDPADWIAAHSRRIGHVHIADHPGRHEPGTGAIDFDALLAALRGCGYGGAIGFEYVPSGTTAESIGFLSRWKSLFGSSRPAFAQEQ